MYIACAIKIFRNRDTMRATKLCFCSTQVWNHAQNLAKSYVEHHKSRNRKRDYIWKLVIFVDTPTSASMHMLVFLHSSRSVSIYIYIYTYTWTINTWTIIHQKSYMIPETWSMKIDTRSITNIIYVTRISNYNVSCHSRYTMRRQKRKHSKRRKQREE